MSTIRNPLLQASLLIFPLVAAQSYGQESAVLFFESFDSTAVSMLPAGWRSSQKKSPGTNDWGTTASTVHSAPGAVLATNATLEQWLSTPSLDCSGIALHQVRMMIRRSGTFTAKVAVEVSIDGGMAFPHLVGTIPREAGSGGYQSAEFPMPPTLADQASVVVRWRILPDSTGTSGTFRMDDISVTSTTGEEVRGDSVVINEIMYSPRAGEPEWVEMLNIGSTTSDLRGWSISDASTTTRHILSGTSARIDPGEYVIVTSDTASLSALRPGIISDMLQASGFPSLNNGGDRVHLFSPSMVCTDSVAYQPSWGGNTGVSIERVDAAGSSMDGSNWVSSADSSGATPGRVNSMVRRAHDLTILHVRPSQQCSGEACDVHVAIRNAGRSPALSWSILLADDLDRDSVADEAEIIGCIPGIGTLAPGDSLTCVFEWMQPVPGKHSIRVEVIMEEDERESNNGMSTSVVIPGIPGSVRINEVMYDPLSGMPEFVEVINALGSAIDLEDCALLDQPTSGGSRNEWKLTGRAFRLHKGNYLAILADSSGPFWFPSLGRTDPGLMVSMSATNLGLNNDGDILVLKSADGIVLDSVRYDPSFHTPDIADVNGRSLELINPALNGADVRNWGTCVDPSGGTPGAENSICVDILPSAALLRASPNPFSPDGDGSDDISVISFSLPMRTALIRVRIFDVRGRLIRELANITPAGAEGNIVWDGRDDHGRRGRIGVYIALMEAIDGGGGVAVAAKCVVVVAGRL